MTSFDKFHPVLTPNYQLDWLTESPIKDVYRLYSSTPLSTVSNEKFPKTILETVTRVNQIMGSIMKGENVIWGISNKSDDQFVGIIGIYAIDKSPTITINFTIFSKDQPAVLTETISRTTRFAEDHFGTTNAKIALLATDENIGKFLLQLVSYLIIK